MGWDASFDWAEVREVSFWIIGAEEGGVGIV